MSQTYYEDEVLIKKFTEGQSQTEIAEEWGVTRESVRQRLKRLGFSGRNYRWIPEQEKLMLAIENSTSLSQVADSFKLTELQVNTAIKYRNMSHILEEARLRWRTHRSEEYYLSKQRPRINQIRELALKIGHTPRQDDLNASGMPGISHTTLIHTFGSIAQAMLAAGLVPNKGRNTSPLPENFLDLNTLTTNIEEIIQRANLLRLLDGNIPAPEGVKEPKQKTVTTLVYYRDTRVVAWVLQYADGICELCGEQGYETDAGIAYLEIHHVIPLSEGGPDMITNAVAVCETCHGKLHRAKNRDELKENLYRNVPRLLSINAF